MSAGVRPARRNGAAVVLVALFLLTSAAAGFLLHRLTAPAQHTLLASARPAATSAVSAAEPEETPAPPVRRIPEQLPAITLPDPDGVTRHLSDWKGKSLLVNFWATWCEPCRREIPLLLELRREHAMQGLEVVGIALDASAAVQQYIRAQGMNYPVLVGEHGGLEAADAFGMDTVLPFSVFADRSGAIITVKVGELHREEAELILDRIREVDAGRLTLVLARQQITEGLRQLHVSRAAPGS